MFTGLKSIFIILLLTFSIQANDNKKAHSVFIELGLKQAATIPMIMKNYIMLEMHNNFKDPEKELEKGIDLFIKLQEKISKLPLDNESKEVIAEHQRIWNKLEAVLKKPVAKERFTEISRYAFPLGTSLRKITEKSKNKVNERQYNVIYYAGKLSGVSQKLASLYMLFNWGRDSSKLQVDMLIEKSIYLDTLVKLEAELSSDGKMDSDSKKILETLKNYFEYYKFLETTTKTFKPALIYSKTNTMFKYSNSMMEMLLKKVNK